MSMTTDEKFYQKVRLLQRRTKCSNFVCNEFVQLFRQSAEDKENFGSLSSFDKKAKHAAGVQYLVIHGCPSCNRHIYTQKDESSACPLCGHPRYSEEHEPLEVAIYYIMHTVASNMNIDYGLLATYTTSYCLYIYSKY